MRFKVARVPLSLERTISTRLGADFYINNLSHGLETKIHLIMIKLESITMNAI